MQIICWQIVAMTVINAIIEQAKKQEVEAVIPPKKKTEYLIEMLSFISKGGVVLSTIR